MTKIRKRFKKRDWKDCCGKLCDDCKIAKAYIKDFGKNDCRKKFKRDYKKINS
jgi:hypothetical protein